MLVSLEAKYKGTHGSVVYNPYDHSRSYMCIHDSVIDVSKYMYIYMISLTVSLEKTSCNGFPESCIARLMLLALSISLLLSLFI